MDLVRILKRKIHIKENLNLPELAGIMAAPPVFTINDVEYGAPGSNIIQMLAPTLILLDLITAGMGDGGACSQLNVELPKDLLL